MTRERLCFRHKSTEGVRLRRLRTIDPAVVEETDTPAWARLTEA